MCHPAPRRCSTPLTRHNTCTRSYVLRFDAGKIVVCDRYVDSMIAYQGAGRVLDADEIRGLADWATGGLVPDLTVVLDVPVERALGEKVDLDRLEAAGTEFHERVRSYFLDLAAQDPSRYLVLPGREDRDTIEAAIRERVQTSWPPKRICIQWHPRDRCRAYETASTYLPLNADRAKRLSFWRPVLPVDRDSQTVFSSSRLVDRA